MSCEKTFAFSPKENDTALDCAIYSSSQAAIFGVKGQWVYRFDATTGQKVSEYRFVDYVFAGESSIVELNGNLYIGVYRTLNENNYQSFSANRDIYLVNYGLSSSLPLGICAATTGFGNIGGSIDGVGGDGFGAGFSSLVTDGTYIYCVHAGIDWVMKIDPTNVSTADFLKDTSFQGQLAITDLAIDTANGVLWKADASNDTIRINRTNASTPFVAGDGAGSTPHNVLNPIVGVCFCPGPQKAYGVKCTNTIVSCNVTQAYSALPSLTDFSWSDLVILQSGANPFRIKFNPYTGKVYIPTWAKNAVEILDPATDTITSVKTGFSSPIDAVFTPTKSFAVQNSSVGLKEIV